MKFFRSTPYHLLLGTLFAVSVFICFATPIGGSFNDVVTLQMNKVAVSAPVKATIVSGSGNDSIIKKMHFTRSDVQHTQDSEFWALPVYRAKDIYGDERRLFAPAGLKVGDVIVADCVYFPSGFDNTETENYFEVIRIERINPVITFPLIQGLGELGRNMLFHVPMSMVAFIAFLLAMIYSIMFLRTKNMDYDFKARASSAIGLMFTILATVTGSIWARFSWGTFWNWDPRETSIFILLLIYIAYFLLRSLLEDGEEKKARIAAVYNIISFLPMIFLIFILPRITQSLHPGSSGTEAPVINLSGKTHTDPILSYILWTNVLLFTLLFLWIKELYTIVLRKEYSIND